MIPDSAVFGPALAAAAQMAKPGLVYAWSERVRATGQGVYGEFCRYDLACPWF
jgi:hypothetical protein